MAIKDIPVDIVSDEEFNKRWGTKADGSWRGYAPGTPTEQRRSNEAKALSDALELQEKTRQFDETMAEDKRRFELEWPYKVQGYNRAASGGGGGTKAPTSSEILSAIRNGAVQYAQQLTQGTPFKASRGLYKGQTFMSSGETPDKAAELTVKMIQSQLGNLPISNANYYDIVKQVYLSLGLEPPSKKDSGQDSLEALVEAVLNKQY